ncbi:MAG: aminotransferase class I/II-fold pyridoxal phosphate-dependent enzyme [bacterium]|nr:aminotransferase class I/II-fold pyridoxal phosphate-dependent enzyme [bacterium]
MRSFNERAQLLGESIFTTLSAQAKAAGAINLSQGFPDFEGPQWVRDLAKSALDRAGKNQYAPAYGAPGFLAALSASYQKHYHLSYDPQGEVLVTNGATEALYCALTALLNPGDEVVVFEPYYDSYLASVQLAGARLKPVTLNLPDLSFDLEDLRAQVSEKTKLLVLNNPHNPTGKVFSPEELEAIAQLAVEFDLWVLSDEVYEFLTFEAPHQPIAQLPGMRERTLTISSVGKTLSLTGWKIGWVCGPRELIAEVNRIHQYVSFCVAHPLQEALAEAWPQMDGYLAEFRATYLNRRNLLVSGLKDCGLEVLSPQGTYFALARTPEGTDDLNYCQELITLKKVATIPLSPFYGRSDQGRRWVRFCFAKREETLLNALVNLRGPA